MSARTAIALSLLTLVGWTERGLAQAPEREGVIVFVVESGGLPVDAASLRAALMESVDQSVASLAEVGPRDPDALVVVAFSRDGSAHIRLHTRSGLRTSIAARPGADADASGRWIVPHVAELLRAATEELGDLGGAPLPPSGLMTWDGSGVVVTSHRTLGLPAWPVHSAAARRGRRPAGERADGLSAPHPRSPQNR